MVFFLEGGVLLFISIYFLSYFFLFLIKEVKVDRVE